MKGLTKCCGDRHLCVRFSLFGADLLIKSDMESVILSREDIEEQVGMDSFTRGATYQRFGRV